MEKAVNIALLIGEGSRVPAVLKCVSRIKNARAVFVISSKGEGVGTRAAARRKIRTEVLRMKDFCKGEDSLLRPHSASRASMGEQGFGGQARERLSAVISAILRGRKTDLVVMAGWTVLIPSSFVRDFRGRIVNIHPSILPSYPGMGERAIKAQWEARWDRDAPPAGCTLHYVDEGMDTGEIIMRGIVYPRDYHSIEEFAEAIHKKEDEVLCRGIKKLVNEMQNG